MLLVRTRMKTTNAERNNWRGWIAIACVGAICLLHVVCFCMPPLPLALDAGLLFLCVRGLADAFGQTSIAERRLHLAAALLASLWLVTPRSLEQPLVLARYKAELALSRVDYETQIARASAAERMAKQFRWRLSNWMAQEVYVVHDAAADGPHPLLTERGGPCWDEIHHLSGFFFVEWVGCS